MTHKLDWDGPVGYEYCSGKAVFLEYDLTATLAGDPGEFTQGKEYRFCAFEPETPMSWEGAYVIDDNNEEVYVRFNGEDKRFFKVVHVDSDKDQDE